MDEIEFRKRVYANPTQLDQETLAAARNDPSLQLILDQTLNLDAELVNVANSIEVPAGLADKLMAIPSQAQATSTPASRPASNNFFQYYAVAASLLMAIGIGVALNLGDDSLADDMAFGNEIMQHVYHEVIQIDAMRAGIDRPAVAMPAVAQVLASADTHFTDDEILQSMPVRYAEPCVIMPAYHSVHLMVKGSQGAVSIIVINNSPVANEFSIRDDRFNGVVVPMGNDGNLILIGEKNEDLNQFKDLFSENMEWTI